VSCYPDEKYSVKCVEMWEKKVVGSGSFSIIYPGMCPLKCLNFEEFIPILMEIPL
jgi:hypothetical protein